MIELQRHVHDDPTGFYGVLWTNEANTHVIVEEDGRWFVRDEAYYSDPFLTFAEAFAEAQQTWGEVTLAPANRLVNNLIEGRVDEIGTFLLEYLADYGTVGIDAQALANLVLARVED